MEELVSVPCISEPPNKIVLRVLTQAMSEVTPTAPGLMDDAEPQLRSLRSASDGSCLGLVVFGGHRSLSEWSADQWTVSPW